MNKKIITLSPLIASGKGFLSALYASLKNSYFTYLFFCFCVFSSALSYSQETRVSAAIDSSHIKIGEQIIYGIKVETDSTHLVVFPDAKAFAPMEVVEAMKTDTTRSEKNFTLLKKYALTKFDSGSYTIPQQKVIVNDRPFLTDSMQVEVATVAVDTTKQKMFPIKPAIEVPQGFVMPQWVWWALAALILLGVAFYFFRRKRKKEAEAQLPPYERALFELKQLDESHLLENRQTKEYYSKLTEAVRRYLEDDVHLRAMESTSSELITYLQLKVGAGELKLSQQTVDDLKKILQRADLAKFANSRPDIITAKEDRSKIEHVITDTKAGIPEPTEEELLRDELYRQNIARRKKRRKIA
ncbi:MAG: LPXTG cell wall anchor domain-containing protein, partial [Gillisia sp.]